MPRPTAARQSPL